jgi:flagella synthesis protein FlgN
VNGTTPLHPSIDQILSEETRALRAFLDLLEQERKALHDGDADRLLALADEKNRSSGQLSRLALRRSQWFAAAGLGSGATAVSAWLNRLPPEAPQRGAWQALLDAALRARALNEECGALIRTRMQHNRQALAVLLAASDQATLYGPDGQAFAGPGKRHLGSV